MAKTIENLNHSKFVRVVSSAAERKENELQAGRYLEKCLSRNSGTLAPNKSSSLAESVEAVRQRTKKLGLYRDLKSARSPLVQKIESEFSTTSNPSSTLVITVVPVDVGERFVASNKDGASCIVPSMPYAIIESKDLVGHLKGVFEANPNQGIALSFPKGNVNQKHEKSNKKRHFGKREFPKISVRTHKSKHPSVGKIKSRRWLKNVPPTPPVFLEVECNKEINDMVNRSLKFLREKGYDFIGENNEPQYEPKDIKGDINCIY